MATVTESNNPASDLAASGTAKLIAQVQVGNNGTGGTWEYQINGVAGHNPWDVGTGLLDSDIVDFVLNVPQGGGTPNPDSWSVGSGTTLQYSGTTYGNITKIGVQAIVSPSNNPGQLIMEWEDVSVTFYDADNIGDSADPLKVVASIESIDPPTNSAPIFNQLTLITPSSGGKVRAVVAGTLRLRSLDSSHSRPPDLKANQIVGKIHVWADNAP